MIFTLVDEIVDYCKNDNCLGCENMDSFDCSILNPTDWDIPVIKKIVRGE